MRKLTFLFFILAALLVVAMPAFAQGSEAAASAGPNWVAITSGFAMALAVALAALGQGRRYGAQSFRPSWYSASADSRTGLHRVPGAVHPDDHLRKGGQVGNYPAK